MDIYQRIGHIKILVSKDKMIANLKINTFFRFSLIAVLLLTIFIHIISCHKNEENKIANLAKTEFPNQEGWNSTMTSTNDGILNAVIRYGHMQRFKKRKVVEFDSGIKIDFYDEKGKHTSKLTSNKGKLDEATNDIEAIENVVVVSDSGINLKTEQIWWNNSLEKVITDKFVTITTVKNDTFYGYGFESDQYFNNWAIRKISGKAGRGLALDIDFSGKKPKPDSVSIDSINYQKESLTDTLSENK